VLREGVNRRRAGKLLLPVLSGALLALPFLRFSLAGVAWAALVPLTVSWRGASWRSGALSGGLAGAVFWLLSLYWIDEVTCVGYVVLCLYLSLFWAAWGAGSVLLWRRPALGWLGAAALWTALEYLRGSLFSGFPWNPLGASQAFVPVLIQPAAATGVYGVSFLIAAANGAWARLLFPGRFRAVPAAAAAAAVGATVWWGRAVLDRAPARAAALPNVTVGLVQAGIRQEIKWNPAFANPIFARHLELTRAAAPRVDLAIWPESSVPWYLEETPEALSALRASLSGSDAVLIVGGDVHEVAESGERYYNAVYLIDREKGIEGRYDKLHLVPFGEFVPLRGLFPFLAGLVPWEHDFTPGKTAAILKSPSLPGVEIGPLVCFEDIVPPLSRDLSRRGANLLVNLTNDAWFGETVQPFQHAAAALFRTVENRVSLVRATNSGYSCLIDPWGRIVGEVRDPSGRVLFASAWTAEEVPLLAGGTFYTRHGDVFVLVCAALAAALLLPALFKKSA